MIFRFGVREGQNERSDQILSFTRTGTKLNQRLCAAFSGTGRECVGYAPAKYVTGGTASPAEDRRGLIGAGWGRSAWIFIGAAGGLAGPVHCAFVKDKFTDSPVLVLDEKGEYVIPILSGHVGGAAALADEVAELPGSCGGTHHGYGRQGKFAVDVFAKKNHLLLTDRSLAKEISAAVLEGERIALYIEETDCTVQGSVPDPVVLCAALRGGGKISFAYRDCGAFRG